jgi:glycosyltransferase involved in cell wall biosynthesis
MWVLTNQTKRDLTCWLSKVVLLPGWYDALKNSETSSHGRAIFSDVKWGWRLFRASRQFQAVVTGSERSALWFVLLQLVLIPWRRRPHILIYTHWNLPWNPLLRFIKIAQYRFLAVCVSRAVVYSRRQCHLYCTRLGVPAHKLAVVPYHTTTYNAQYDITEGSYVFSGGDHTRDYRTLIEAVRGTSWPVIIAAQQRSYFDGIDIPGNVSLRTVCHEEFVQLMAGAAAVVVPLAPGLLHAGGQQSYLNAMALGKPVIVADDCGADEYIQTGIDGFVIDPGDVSSLRKILTSVLTDRTLAKRLGENAKLAAAKFSPEHFCAQVFDIVQTCIGPATSTRVHSRR